MHDERAAQGETFGKFDHRIALEQQGQRVAGEQRRRARSDRSGCPGRRDLASNDSLAAVGGQTIDPSEFVREPLPYRQQQPGDQVELARFELGDRRDLGFPAVAEPGFVGFLPVRLGHRRAGNV